MPTSGICELARVAHRARRRRRGAAPRRRSSRRPVVALEEVRDDDDARAHLHRARDPAQRRLQVGRVGRRRPAVARCRAPGRSAAMNAGLPWRAGRCTRRSPPLTTKPTRLPPPRCTSPNAAAAASTTSRFSDPTVPKSRLAERSTTIHVSTRALVLGPPHEGLARPRREVPVDEARVVAGLVGAGARALAAAARGAWSRGRRSRGRRGDGAPRGRADAARRRGTRPPAPRTPGRTAAGRHPAALTTSGVAVGALRDLRGDARRVDAAEHLAQHVVGA